MSKTTSANGSCLCGSVKIKASQINQKMDACHCSTCRTWGGGPFFSINCGSNISFIGEKNISVYDSSKWAERGFCKNCGTHLFYRIKQNQSYSIPAGVFTDDKDFSFYLQMFVEEKPDYYCFANETRMLTGKEAFAEFTP